MSEAPERTRDEVAVMLAILCTHTDQIRHTLHPTAQGAALVEEVLRAARTGADVATPLHTLDAILQSLGDAHGVYAYAETSGPHTYTCGVASAGSGARGLHLAGIDSARPGEADYRCPAGLCARSWRPDPASPVPTCHVTAQPLRRTPRT
ncbi:hypothetical protein F4561_005237 [Lipingzhangella halophila]|uniref:Uncharacterized protein n=1 Tax=Lipingzhangella halophila TaxID=1783352 RepID=A0A7W7RMC7_9ACTN|nr:hypothetical protein [Lipingzhangella halophila]MBB4934417.1 hypothetical protein [Lipingzhangella halophila]